MENAENILKKANARLMMFGLAAIGLWMIGIIESTLSLYSEGSLSKLSAYFLFGGFVLYFYSKDELGIFKKLKINQRFFVACIFLSFMMALWLVLVEYM